MSHDHRCNCWRAGHTRSWVTSLDPELPSLLLRPPLMVFTVPQSYRPLWTYSQVRYIVGCVVMNRDMYLHALQNVCILVYVKIQDSVILT